MDLKRMQVSAIMDTVVGKMQIIMLIDKIKKLKKLILLGVVLLVGLLGVLLLKPKKAADPIDISQVAEMPRYGVQDLRTWSQGEANLADEPLDMDGYGIYRYRLDTDTLEAYIAMMEQNGFTLVDEHHQSSFLGSYQSYGLLCDGALDVPTQDMMYTDTQCHVNIWKVDSKWQVEVCNGLRLYDMGLRRDGTAVSVMPQGQSVAAGLRHHAGGKYKTTDGRLSAKIGNAMVIYNGERETCQASWERSSGRVHITVEISDELTARFSFLEEDVKRGDVFSLGMIEENTATFTLTAGDQEISAKQLGKAMFRHVTLRVMHLGENDETVLYVYAEPMDTKNYPEGVEILCAVNTTPEKSNSSGGGWWKAIIKNPRLKSVMS